jgi:4-hydroxy-3-methylbut-2-enyl diphosphate reductase
MTCHDVKKIHAIVAYASARGMDVIVCGTPGHPETAGIMSRVTTQAVLVQDVEEARQVIPALTFSLQGVCLVAQTTHDYQTYEGVHAFLANECANIPLLEPHNTVCQSTAHRQNELRELAKTADACVIVGGKNSSNVTKLYKIACEHCASVQHVESVTQLNIEVLKNKNTVVVAGGASTPNNNVEDVIKMITSYYPKEERE